MAKVLVTGGAGYIGSQLVRELLIKGYRVITIDNLRHGGESLLEILGNKALRFVKEDIRETGKIAEHFQDIAAVIHLAAIVGDPACAKEPELAESINLQASKQLYQIAEQAGVNKFIFASTCSNYGKMADHTKYVTEESVLSPVSLYAKTKVHFEQYLLKQPDTNICKPTVLRFATAYGLSPRIRFDLTVNEFTKELALGRELVIYGEQFWRPYCHVQDLVGALILTLETEKDMAFNVFNVGDTSENYQKQMIVDLIVREIPDAKIKYVARDEDPRDYRVCFDKIKDYLDYSITRKVPDGIREILNVVQNGFLLNPDDIKYSNNVVVDQTHGS